MRRKLIKILLGMIGVLLLLFALYGLWVWLQMRLMASLVSGSVQVQNLHLILPQSPLVYGLLAGVFLLLTAVFVWIAYRLVAVGADRPQE